MAAPRTQDADPQQLVEAGLTALKLGDAQNARHCFAQALSLEPTQYEALYWMSYFARRRADALDYLRRALTHSRREGSAQRELIRERVRELARGGDPGAQAAELEARARRWEAVREESLVLSQGWLLGGVLGLALVLLLGAWMMLSRAQPAARSGGEGADIVIITPTPTRLPGGAAAPTPTPTPEPTATPTAEPTQTPVVYVVQPGDTLFGIALEHGVDPEALQEANQIDDPGTLQVGQELIIPATPTAEP